MLKSKPKRIFLSPPHMGGEELHFVREAFESNYIAPLGPQVDAFEREFAEKIGIQHAVAVSSGTAAMHLALRILGVGPGDEVIASTLTFIGSITPIIFQGATPVFIDSDRFSWNIDPDLLAEELHACKKRRQLPKAVVPTDLYGQCASPQRVLDVCEHYGVPVVVDAAESLGAKYKKKAENIGLVTEEDGWIHTGVGANAAVFSFNGNKIITSSGGGMLVSDDRHLIEQARFLSQQARDPAPHYEHSQIGYNYRMSNIVAAVAIGQLRVLEQRVEQKRKIYSYYKEALSGLPGIEFMPESQYGRSTRWLTAILIDPDEFGADRETVRLSLEEHNIESRPLWKPMHLQPVFSTEGSIGAETGEGKLEAKYAGSSGNSPYKIRVVGGGVSEYLFARGLCLPSGTQMSEQDLNRIVRIIKNVHGR